MALPARVSVPSEVSASTQIPLTSPPPTAAVTVPEMDPVVPVAEAWEPITIALPRTKTTHVAALTSRPERQRSRTASTRSDARDVRPVCLIDRAMTLTVHAGRHE